MADEKPNGDFPRVFSITPHDEDWKKLTAVNCEQRPGCDFIERVTIGNHEYCKFNCSGSIVLVQCPPGAGGG